MKKGLTELVFIVDMSGSMADMRADTIGGINTVLADQRKDKDEVLVSTVVFNNRSYVVHDRIPLTQVPDMTEADYSPRGCTALLDAVGDAIHHIGNVHKYIREEDVPEKTVFVITTDGMENASSRYSGTDVRAMVEQKKETCGWEFLFLAANLDAAETAAGMGIDRSRAVNYHNDARGNAVKFGAASVAVKYLKRDISLDERPSWRAEADKDFETRR